MADEQDRAEALDDDKFDDIDDDRPPVALVDQTADADPDTAPIGAAELDAGETGSSMDGVLGEPDPDDDPLYPDLVPPAPEEDAMHVVDEP
jgi:hypothetical protein